jgi:hypothetical protein
MTFCIAIAIECKTIMNLTIISNALQPSARRRVSMEERVSPPTVATVVMVTPAMSVKQVSRRTY